MAGDRMICPRCGIEMNPHALKPSEPTSPAEAARVDPDLGVVLDEVHTCPGCGESAARPG